MGAAPARSDPRAIRDLLAAAQGYAVLGPEGGQVGVFIELAGPGGEHIAIRQDGFLLWRRRLLPITTVAGVFPERRAILLNVERRELADSLAGPDALAGTPPSAEEAAELSGALQERVARYASASENDADRADAGRSTPDPAQHNQRGEARHLLFVSTTHGYTLVEQEGSPPPLGQAIEVPEQSDSFRVAKLGPSPLPNDWRICAYLERTEELSAKRREQAVE
jgi:hypothetical protein